MNLRVTQTFIAGVISLASLAAEGYIEYDDEDKN